MTAPTLQPESVGAGSLDGNSLRSAGLQPEMPLLSHFSLLLASSVAGAYLLCQNQALLSMVEEFGQKGFSLISEKRNS